MIFCAKNSKNAQKNVFNSEIGHIRSIIYLKLNIKFVSIWRFLVRKRKKEKKAILDKSNLELCLLEVKLCEKVKPHVLHFLKNDF